ncbi:aromatic ring-hydroxylating dioxygenase subunit alpha [Roseivirga sp.]|uniref:aromatic ring-hydroxylating oxygenase subunit alpha n=1 Tax=Roseivirga sp. TaxID=1964215 RepID=UPI002B2723D6|nr:aromatic ring-hydroxylating dioxygenase subunit alpha [Roseivirga sp.]
MPNYSIHPEIEKAHTLPSSFYRDIQVFEAMKEKVFLKAWQWIGDESLVKLPKQVYPFTLLDGYLTEPVLLTRTEDEEIHGLTNVCTHRGNIVCHHPGSERKLVCKYHGRRFGLDGAFEHMPEFKEAENFPCASDSLHQFPLKQLGPLLFMGLDPSFDFEPVLEGMIERIGFMPLHEFRHDAQRSQDYLVNAHWSLYCDNYLEGFHIPFVHSDLNAVLDYGSYETVLYEHMNLQIGYSDSSEDTFDLPEGHMDYGKNVAAYYFWVFPNMMFNFYPWGLSINVVKPISVNRTRVSFITYVYDESKMDSGAGALLDKVEREDEFVVEGVQKGINSRFYKSGRYSPKMEKGVHHFHSLLCKFLED